MATSLANLCHTPRLINLLPPKSSCERKPLPPGPKECPIIGNLLAQENEMADLGKTLPCEPSMISIQ